MYKIKKIQFLKLEFYGPQELYSHSMRGGNDKNDQFIGLEKQPQVNQETIYNIKNFVTQQTLFDIFKEKIQNSNISFSILAMNLYKRVKNLSCVLTLSFSFTIFYIN